MQDNPSTGRGHGAHHSQQGNIVELHPVIRLIELEGGAAGLYSSGNLV